MTAVCAPHLALSALPGMPVVMPGDDLASLIGDGLARAGLVLADGDVIVVASKLVSRAEARYVDLATVDASPRAQVLAQEVDRDARLVELILRESTAVSRTARGVLVVRHRLGFVAANAGIDQSNAMPPGAAPGSGPWVLLLPEDPDATAARLRAALGERSGAGGADVGVIISDSMGRPFRLGTVGAAIGVAGLPALVDGRGQPDLFGRPLMATVTALADQIAAAADLVAGQADEGRGAIHVRAGWCARPSRTSTHERVAPRRGALGWRGRCAVCPGARGRAASRCADGRGQHR
ncbi:MAG TPA: coenzyme F420-0:L-glutamate ligase [Haliangium sp.]|nr:coenzyme F420-0:L-glutamate ligase [Haliangium sp.]